MSESASRKVNRLAMQRQAETGEAFEVAMEHVLRDDVVLAEQYRQTLNDIIDTPADEGGIYSHLTPQQATQKLIQLTRDRMALTGERDYSRACFSILAQHPELAKLNLMED